MQLLNISSVPCELINLNKLKHVLIFRRILFNKFIIMSKGCSKLKSAICNKPAEKNDIVNVLPHGADNIGQIFLIFNPKMARTVKNKKCIF